MNAARHHGFSMIEVLITIAILMVGLLGLAGLQSRVAAAEFEAYQRAQALVLIQEFVDRMAANKASAAAYVRSDIGAAGTELSCVGITNTADRDLCELNNALVGAAEKGSGGSVNVGAMIGARACVTSPAANSYVITIAWQGLTPTKAPLETCGALSYGDDKLRRTVSMPFRVATLLIN